MNRKKLHNYNQDDIAGYIMLFPWLIGFFIFTMFPLLSSLYYSFTDFNILASPKWTGLSNFRAVFADQRFYQSMKVTFNYVLINVPLKLLFALGIALLFNTKHKGLAVYRAIYYLPSIVGGSIAVAVMWTQLFSASGAFNSMLAKLGIIYNKNWIGSPDTALGMLIVLGIWQFGSPMLIFLAGLKQIPVSYYEAAKIDGANSFQQFLYITLPSLSPVIFFNLLMQIIGGFMSFTQCYIVSNGTGGPSDTTMFYALYIYLQGLKYYKMGYSCALAWIMVAIIGVCTVLIFKTSDKWVFYEDK